MNILESYNKIAKSLLLESEDDRYVSIGFGRFKLKGKENDEDAEVLIPVSGTAVRKIPKKVRRAAFKGTRGRAIRRKA